MITIDKSEHVVIENKPGETITVKSGVIPKSITIRNSPGVIVTGITFKDQDLGVYGSDNAFLKIERSPDALVERCAWINCNPADLSKEYKWLYFKHSPSATIKHCTFDGKQNLGTVAAIYVDDTSAGAGDYYFYRCLFKDNAATGKAASLNGTECIRIYDSQRSMLSAKSMVEECLFINCGSDGEPEVVSVKACDVTLCRNVLIDCKGTLTLRHGKRSKMIENHITGGKIGLRLFDSDHVVIGNYIKGQRGKVGFSGAIVLGYGIPNSPINGYFAADNATVKNNSIIDCEVGIIATNGGKSEATIKPQNVRIIEGKSPYEIGELKPISISHVGIDGSDDVIDNPPPPADTSAEIQILKLEIGELRETLVNYISANDNRWLAIRSALNS